MTNGLLGALSLARRAGALQWGFGAVKEEVLAGRAHLVLITNDLGRSTKSKTTLFCSGKVPVVQVPLGQGAVVQLTKKPVGVFAVCNPNFAQLCRQNIPKEENPNEEETTC